MTTQLSHIDPHVRDTIISAYSEIANYFKEHCTFTDEERENLEHSPERVARALFEMVFTTEEIEQKLGAILRKVFPLASAETTRFLWPLPIIQGPILVHGICPHHFLPIMYSVTYGYSALEGNGVLGISKLTRIAKILARRPIMQEQYTKDLASVLTRHTISGTHTLGNDQEFVQAPLAGAIVTGAHCCYSPDTEVLTEEGWVRFDKLKKGIKAVQVDISTGEATAVAPLSYIKQRNSFSELIHFEGPMVDLLVTPDHRMVYNGTWRYSNGKDWIVGSAQDMPNAFYVPTKIDWCGGDDIDDHTFDGVRINGMDFAKLLGLYYAEGCWRGTCITDQDGVPTYSSSGVEINQKVGTPEAKKMRKFLYRLGFNIHEYTDTKTQIIFWKIKSPALGDYVLQVGRYCTETRVPTLIKRATKPYIIAFLKGYYLGDGDKFHRKEGSSLNRGSVISTASKDMAEDLQLLYYLAGKLTHIHSYEGAPYQKGGNKYRIWQQIGKKLVRDGLMGAYVNVQRHKTEVKYSGFVYCIEVPTGALVVRRNGKISVCGNCMLCRGVESPATTTTESLDYSQWYQTNEEYGLPVSGSNITNDPQAKNLNEKLWLVHNHNHRVI